MKKVLSAVTAIMILLGICVGASANSQSKTIKPGDYMVLGMLYGKPILWQCVDIDENGPLMYSAKILDVREYDSKGENFTGSHMNNYERRRMYGSNRWSDSNIRDWLRSGEKIVYTCGNSPVIMFGKVADKNLERYYYGGFLKFFTQQELDCVKTVNVKTPIYESEYPDMSPYEKTVSEKELLLMQDPSVEKEILKLHAKAPEVAVYWKNGKIEGMFEQNKYEETTQETFFLPTVFILQELQLKSAVNNYGIKNILHKNVTEESDCYKDAFRYYLNSDFYEDSEYGSRFAVATRTPVVDTPDLVCYSSEYLKAKNMHKETFHHEQSLAPVYINSEITDYAYDDTHYIAPMFYLKENVGFAGGDGSYYNPYSIEHNGTQVMVNGRNVFMTEEPYVSGNKGLVPVDDLCEALGVRVNKSSAYMPQNENCVYLTYGNTTYQITGGSQYAVNVATGEKIQMDAVAECKAVYSETFKVGTGAGTAQKTMEVRKVFATVDSVCNLFGFPLWWDSVNGNLHITTPSGKYFENYPQTCYPKFTCFYQTESTSGVYEYEAAASALDDYRNYLSTIGIRFTESAEIDGETVLRYSYDGAMPYDSLKITIDKETKTFRVSTWDIIDKYHYEEQIK